MRTEKQSDTFERYLFAEEYFSDNAIASWKQECFSRCKDKSKGFAYNRFINWIKQNNEIAVFTLYAYADFPIPKFFDVVFQIDKPDNFVKTQYELTQSIYEAWFPSDLIEHGHKHLCAFRFDEGLPAILNLLHEDLGKFSTAPAKQIKLGFCNSIDFESIKTYLTSNRP